MQGSGFFVSSVRSERLIYKQLRWALYLAGREMRGRMSVSMCGRSSARMNNSEYNAEELKERRE
jgi:hypothetical protein